MRKDKGNSKNKPKAQRNKQKKVLGHRKTDLVEGKEKTSKGIYEEKNKVCKDNKSNK